LIVLESKTILHYKMNNIVFKLDSTALLPKRGSIYSAGYDIHANQPTVIHPHSRVLISTGVWLHTMDPSHYIRVAPRSGLAVRNSIDVGAGVVDPDYTGEIKVLLINNGNTDFFVNEHDRIAQLIVEKFAHDTTIVGIRDNMEIHEEVINAERGGAGFGSTGLNDSALNNV
jgi:dUTP pyrophosphatase